MSNSSVNKQQQPNFIARLLPSLLTLCALGSGLTAVRLSISGQFEYAYGFLMLSAFFDGADGHVARALGTSSAFGAELDSLCDLVDFGVSPTMVMYFWTTNVLKNCNQTSKPLIEFMGIELVYDFVLWFAAIAYSACCAVRLARFNLSDNMPAPQPPHSTRFSIGEAASDELFSDESDTAEAAPRYSLRSRDKIVKLTPNRVQYTQATKVNKLVNTKRKKRVIIGQILDQYINKNKFFNGVPAPAGALLSLFPVSYFQLYPQTRCTANVELYIIGWFLLVGFLMVSSIHTFSSKMLIKGPIRVRDPSTSHFMSKSFFSAVAKLAIVAFLFYSFAFYPVMVIFIGSGIYLLSIPLGHISYLCLKTTEEAAVSSG